MRRNERVPRPAAAAIVAAAIMVVGAAAPAAGATAPTDGGGSAGAEPAQVDAPVPELNWGGCGEGLAQFDCTSVEVPSDYDQPHGATTEIAITRLPATDPENKIGTLFTNFGGPGGPGVANLHAMGETLYTDEVRARFDIIGFDPRGVGLSDPVTCFPNAEQEAEFAGSMEAFPQGRQETARFMGQIATFGASCAAVSGDRLATASTANVARDMDLLRQAVGDEELNYVGYSYGTILGATYGQLFPDRIRAMVLDGTIDPEAWVGEGDDRDVSIRIGQHTGASRAYGEFLRLCEEAGPEQCALAGLGDPEQVMEDLFDQLKETPAQVPQPDGSTIEIGYDNAVNTMYQGLYRPMQWTGLAAAMASLVEPDQQARSFSAQSGMDSIRDFLREIGVLEDYASSGGGLASMCMDTENPRLLEYPAAAAAAAEEAEHFGAARSWTGAVCSSMWVEDEDAYTGPWQQSTDAPVLVIGTRYDPATPQENVEPYADLWQDSRVLTVEGYGHTTMLAPSTCADLAIADYLIDLEATDGATCGQDVAPFTPAAQSEQPEVAPATIG